MIGAALKAAGAQQHGPGVYVLNGKIHVDAEVLLLAFGIEPTPANVRRLELRAATELGLPVESHEHPVRHG